LRTVAPFLNQLTAQPLKDGLQQPKMVLRRNVLAYELRLGGLKLSKPRSRAAPGVIIIDKLSALLSLAFLYVLNHPI